MKLTWEALDRLAEWHGEAFYLVDFDRFKENYDGLLQAFRSIYPDTHIAYSYKTNYTPDLCARVNAWGGYAEVVSKMEYDLAKTLSVPPSRIIFNGPCKSVHDLAAALTDGALVNLDSLREARLAVQIARDHPSHRFTLGLRCNFDLGKDRISRFGFDVTGEDFSEALALIAATENCTVTGLHCHHSSPFREAAAYALRAEKLLGLADGIFKKNRPSFLDVGGGFYGKMPPELERQFAEPVPSFEEYAAAVAAAFAGRYPRGAAGPRLILEPGAALAADIMRFAARVVDLKTVRSRHMAFLAGSVYDIKPTLNAMNLPVCVKRNPAAVPQTRRPIDMVGYTCSEADCLYRGYEGAVAAGDFAVFDNVGAYTLVLRPPFIRPCPPVISCGPGADSATVIKHRERFSDVFQGYTATEQSKGGATADK
jgi:diaminopimelate decarboxylase